MDLGARRLDLIGLKFELAQEIAAAYAQAVAQQHDKTQTDDHVQRCSARSAATTAAARICATPIRPSKGEYSQVWLSENRPYWLNNVTVRYDLEIERWQRRAEQFEAASVRLGITARTCRRPRRLGCRRP